MKRAIEQESLAQKSGIQRHKRLLKSDVQKHKAVRLERRKTEQLFSAVALCVCFPARHLSGSECQSDGSSTAAATSKNNSVKNAPSEGVAEVSFSPTCTLRSAPPGGPQPVKQLTTR